MLCASVTDYWSHNTTRAVYGTLVTRLFNFPLPLLASLRTWAPGTNWVLPPPPAPSRSLHKAEDISTNGRTFQRISNETKRAFRDRWKSTQFFFVEKLGAPDDSAPLNFVHPYVVVTRPLSSHCNLTNVYIITPAPTAGGGGMLLSGRPTGRPLARISRDAIPLYSVETFQWNLPQIFIMWVSIAEQVFKVIGQRSRGQRSKSNVWRRLGRCLIMTSMRRHQSYRCWETTVGVRWVRSCLLYTSDAADE